MMVLHEILRKLHATTNGDRLLDLQIMRVIAGKPIEVDTFWTADDLILWAGEEEVINVRLMPHLTTSIDDALALAQREIPEANCFSIEIDGKIVEASISRNNVKSGHWYHNGYHPRQPAVAILIALFNAKIVMRSGA